MFEKQSTGGLWTNDEQNLHIKGLELKAVLLGLKSWFTDQSNVHIRIKSDNTTAVAYVNNKGGVKSLDCHRIALEIWSWAIDRDIIITAEHLPGSKNVLADKASRVFDMNTEWELNEIVYRAVENNFGKFDIDLFASRINAKNNIYASWKPDPNASIIDSFTADWSNYNFYAFPPFNMIMKTLTKVQADQATGVLICPLWQTQPWYPKLMLMLASIPLLLPLDVISLPFNKTISHKQQKYLRLIACYISGNSSIAGGFRMKQLQSSVHPGAHQLLNNMKSILESGFLTVVKGTWIPYHMMRSKS